MKKVGLLCIVLLVALCTLVVAYASWSSNLAINGSFTTATYPTATTNAATSVTSTTAQLNGYLGTVGSASSVNLYFDWGTTQSYGATVTATPSTASGGGISFTYNLTGLTPRTTYHFRAKAAGGVTGYGADQQFTTAKKN